jgi:hypothetical protein
LPNPVEDSFYLSSNGRTVEAGLANPLRSFTGHLTATFSVLRRGATMTAKIIQEIHDLIAPYREELSGVMLTLACVGFFFAFPKFRGVE